MEWEWGKSTQKGDSGYIFFWQVGTDCKCASWVICLRRWTDEVAEVRRMNERIRRCLVSTWSTEHVLNAGQVVRSDKEKDFVWEALLDLMA